PDPDFALSPYFPALRETAAEYGLNVTVAEKTKVLQGSVRSAELKGGMREHLIHFFAEAADGACANEVVRIRFDVDTNPPAGAVHETRHLAAPDSCPVRLHAIPSLFAGKILAVLCRGWRGRVKGRDLYDFAFYLSLGARFSLPYLHAGLIRAGRLSPEDACTPDTVRDMLCARFASLDFAMARDDAAPFVRDPAPLALWSADHFAGLAQELGAEDGC
ncbi:MAG: nucleotidyl transferase AbiEii/AbiGii toxin family protein, partial [Desulfovibrionaceae bacterium]|nr:nucleotidyl transferase AbiEii/AbiGii toxin family protein [Desulfovibrionaceae bacterium]